MVRGFERLIDDIRNPRASKKDRKKKIDSLPDIPPIPGFRLPGITKAAKELAKVFVELGPEAGNPRFFDAPTPPIITRHTQEQLDFEAGLTRPPQEMIEMDAQEALTEVINNPAIEISPEMIEIINSPAFMMDRNGQVSRSNQFGNQFGQQRTIPRKKRKVSAYSKRFGLELKKLKKLHPRTKVQDLMKRAHRATKRAMK
tara:strand:- start:8 stop:607 length:600 start_codon:yes stop_codon:yes gene_type:complete